MRILFLTSAHNGMSQRLQTDLIDTGHEVSIELALSDELMTEAAESYDPDLIVAPMLKKAIPERIWRKWVCVIVHPGIKGDRGPSSLDWALLEGDEQWGVTLLQANAEMDAGDIWASTSFPVRASSKSSIYQNEVCDAASWCLRQMIENFSTPSHKPEPLDYSRPDVHGRLRPPMKQVDRAIDWSASTDEIARHIRSADGSPGVLDHIFDQPFYLFGAHEEDGLKGEPGEVIARRLGAICRATGDGALWITHLKAPSIPGENPSIKLPATTLLQGRLQDVPKVPIAVDARPIGRTYREIWYEETAEVGHLHFDFYNGAMSTEGCLRLREAFREVAARPTKVLVLWGGRNYFSNGIDLNGIEASNDAPQESWRNIQAIDDVVQELILTKKPLVSAIQGNAGAGGAIMPLAADLVLARDGVILNPHYKGMGNLYGSEYWTYLLPKRVGAQIAAELTENLLPLSVNRALKLGMIDAVLSRDPLDFHEQVTARAVALARAPDYAQRLRRKLEMRVADEAQKPIAEYRREELAKMRVNFFGADRSYHEARRRFVYKKGATETPLHIALHRQQGFRLPARPAKLALKSTRNELIAAVLSPVRESGAPMTRPSLRTASATITSLVAKRVKEPVS